MTVLSMLNIHTVHTYVHTYKHTHIYIHISRRTVVSGERSTKDQQENMKFTIICHLAAFFFIYIYIYIVTDKKAAK